VLFFYSENAPEVGNSITNAVPFPDPSLRAEIAPPCISMIAY
jgi:hypothetical protein